MPELPDVESTRQRITDPILGCTVKLVECLDEQLILGSGCEKFRQMLEGSEIIETDRRGKVLILRFSCGWSLLVHFRMTGGMSVIEGDEGPPEYIRTVFELDGNRSLVHHDMRRLGTLELVQTSDECDAKTLENIGRDALQDPPSTDELLEQMSDRRLAIKKFLLDQRPMSGVGNVCASEILYRARIHPQTAACELERGQVKALLQATDDILKQFLVDRGAQVEGQAAIEGIPENMPKLPMVYDREGEQCRRAGCDSEIRRIIQSNRSTYYCPTCQALSDE